MELNRLVIGTASFGSKVDWASSLNILSNMQRFGCSKIDTASVYGAGQAEDIILSHINSHIAEKWEITGKFGLVNRYENVPSFMTSLGRWCLYFRFFKIIKNAMFSNKKKYATEPYVSEKLRHYDDKFGRSFKRFCFHDPAPDEVKSIDEILNKVKVKYPNISFGMSINVSNVSLFNDPGLINNFEYVNLDCKLFVEKNIQYNGKIFLYSIYSFLSNGQSNEVNLKQCDNFKTLKKKFMDSDQDVYFIVDIKDLNRLKFWYNFAHEISHENY